MTPTIDQLFSAGANAQPYSIDQILAGIQGQYTARPQYQPSMTIDDILAGLAQVPQQATPYETGAQRFVSDVAPSAEYFKPAEFNLEDYRMAYQSAQEKYAAQLEAQGVPKQQAREQAGLGQTAGSIAGAYYGNAVGGPIGGMIGSAIGGTVGGFVDSLF